MEVSVCLVKKIVEQAGNCLVKLLIHATMRDSKSARAEREKCENKCRVSLNRVAREFHLRLVCEFSQKRLYCLCVWSYRKPV